MDQEDLHCKVLPGVSDHSLVAAKLKLIEPRTLTVEREVWDFSKANWNAAKELLTKTDWTCLTLLSGDESAAFFSGRLLEVLALCVPKRKLKEQKQTHPWLTEEVLTLVAVKQRAKGTAEETAAARACSEGLLKAYRDYVGRVKRELAELKPGARKWWSKSRELLELKGKTCNIPALKDTGGNWVTTARGKADLFVETFSAKYILHAAEENEYSFLAEATAVRGGWSLPTEEQAKEVLKALRADSATGPDLVPTRLLKECADELAHPLLLSGQRIMETKRWPEA